jgi:hypothetical protein
MLALYPNPSSAGATLAINGITDLSETVRVVVVALDGRTLQTLEGALTDVNKALNNQVEGLPMGMYTIKVSLADQVQTLKLIKR